MISNKNRPYRCMEGMLILKQKKNGDLDLLREKNYETFILDSPLLFEKKKNYEGRQLYDK